MPQMVKLGLFMSVALALLAYLILEVEDLSLWGPRGQVVEASFESVAGLDDKAAVRVAGVRVGRVDGIRLEGDRALVRLLLESPVELRQGAAAAIANLGLLGDKYIELDLGAAAAPPLAPGEVLPGVTPVGWDETMAKLDGIGTSIEATLGALDPEETGRTLSRLLATLDETAAALRQMIAANQAHVSGTAANFERFSAGLAESLPELTDQLQGVLAQIEGVIADNREILGESLGSIGASAERLQVSIDHLNTISGKIAAGEGTLGKLVTSDETHDRLVGALESVESGVTTLSDTLGRVQRLRLDFGFDSYYLEAAEGTRGSFELRIDPETDKFYRVAVVDDPRGRERLKTEFVTVTAPDGTVETTRTDRLAREDKVTFDAQVGFELGAAQLRAGLLESTGGASLDYYLLDDRLRLTLDAFQFNREEDLEPHLRFLTRFHVTPSLYLLGGYDDFLESERDSFFLGGGFTWSDDDLKYLIGSIPRF